MEQLCLAYIRSLLEYGDVVYANVAQNDLNILDKINKKGAKIVAGGISIVSDETIANNLCSQLYITIHQHISVTSCPIVYTQEVETDIILGTLSVWTTFHAEQLNRLFLRPQLFF